MSGPGDTGQGDDEVTAAQSAEEDSVGGAGGASSAEAGPAEAPSEFEEQRQRILDQMVESDVQSHTSATGASWTRFGADNARKAIDLINREQMRKRRFKQTRVRFR